MINIEIEKIVNILQAIGCKISFNENELYFSDKHLISPFMLNKIYEYEDDIKAYLQNDISIMSISSNKGCVGQELKKLLVNISDKYNLFKYYEEFDARGYEWCSNNIEKIIAKLSIFTNQNQLEFSNKSARILVRKAILNTKKDIIS